MKSLKHVGSADHRTWRGPGGLAELYRPGFYSWQYSQGSTATGTQTVNRLEVYPRWISRSIAIDKIAVETTVVSSAGGVIRLGMWANDAKEDFPGALLFESSTIAVDSGTGIKESATLGPKVFRPGLYWFGVVSQTASPTFRTTNAVATINLPLSGAPGSGVRDSTYAKTGTSGALPDPFSSATSQLTGAQVLIGILVGA